MKKQLSTFSATLLVAGTTIGAGLLALPVSSAESGFFYSILALLVVWAVMLMGSLYLLEVASSFKPGVNLVTLSNATLGAWGKWSAWLTYLLLLYALNAAYLSSLSTLLQTALLRSWQVNVPTWSAAICMVGLLLWVLLAGIGWIDRINRVLMMGLLVTCLTVLALLAPNIEPSLWLVPHRIEHLPSACLVMITSFGFSIIVPSLREYMGFEGRANLALSVVLGSAIALVLYAVWLGFVMGVVPMEGAMGLQALLAHGQPSVGLAQSMAALLQQPLFSTLFMLFSAFLVLTSFIGVSLSLFDFLADGLALSKQGLNRFITCVLTLCPPLLFTLYNPQGFIIALSYAGVLVAFLLVFLPAMMVYQARKVNSHQPLYRAPGGRIIMVLSMVIAWACIIFDSVT